MSTEPPLRRAWDMMPGDRFESVGLKILPNSEYGVQPIWRMASAAPIQVIAFGPPRLTKDLAGPSIVVPPEERIHSLAWLQRAGLITSEEMELAIDRLLGANARPAPPPQPAPKAAISTAHPSTSKTRRVFLAYAASAVILVLALIVGGQLVGRLLFTHPSAVQILPAASPTAEQPSPSPTPTAATVNLRPILIKPSDVRAGYGLVKSDDSNPLCGTCVPALYSLTVGLQNIQLHRYILSAASVAPSVGDSHSVAHALTTFIGGNWVVGNGLGDESFLFSSTSAGRTYFYVVWVSGTVTQEIMLIAPTGTRTMQDAIDLAKIQQARLARARP